MPSSACYCDTRYLHPFPTRRSSDLVTRSRCRGFWRQPPRTNSRASQSSSSGWLGGSPSRPRSLAVVTSPRPKCCCQTRLTITRVVRRSEEHTSELQSLRHLVCRLLLVTATPDIYTLSLHDALPIW